MLPPAALPPFSAARVGGGSDGVGGILPEPGGRYHHRLRGLVAAGWL